MTISKIKARTHFVRAAVIATLLSITGGLSRADTRDVTRDDKSKVVVAPSPRSGLRVGRGRTLTGVASFYGRECQGSATASGERFNMHAMTLACRHLPMGTRVVVTNLRTGRSAVGRVNDYGPNGRCRHRIADLSQGLARRIGLVDGLAKVRVEVIR